MYDFNKDALVALKGIREALEKIATQMEYDASVRLEQTATVVQAIYEVASKVRDA